ncbi:hypothetical protein C8R45DRAFT_1166500 [Mycena sanguinolenta]|nr:hypothetical protein C8R45DRAFT_1166500 [Mycena sanguinolenta]
MSLFAVDVFGSIHTVPAFVAALRGRHAIPGLRAISSHIGVGARLEHFIFPRYPTHTFAETPAEFGDVLVPVVPKITTMLTSKNSDTHIRLEVFENLLQVADHARGGHHVGKLRIKIQEHVYAIVPLLKDLHSELLATLLPMILSTSETPTSWGQMVLIARLLEHRRLNLEETNLRFILCLITSKNTEVQDFMLKFMTRTLQQYLETWRNADKFPSGFASAFSPLAMLKR